MFDTIAGLPVHVLVVHAVVVLVPLMWLVTLAFTLRPRWRPGLGWAVLGNAVASAAAVVSKESGEQFLGRLGIGGEAVQAHVDYGDRLPLFVLGQLAASVLAWLLVARPASPGRGAVVAAAVLVLLVGGAATGWTVLTGDSGARAVWEGVLL